MPRRLSLLASAMVLVCAIGAPAKAQVIDQPGGDLQWVRRVPLAPSVLGPKIFGAASPDAAYSNLRFFQNQSFAAGGATQQFFNTITRLAADDLNLVGAPPYSVNGFRFTVTNLNAVDVSARPLVRFYLPNGPGGGPGTLIEARTYNPITFTAGVVGTIKTSSQFVIRSSHIWAGIAFDNNSGTTGATAAQLDGLAQGIFSPADLGTSADQYFVTTAAGSFASDNPAGTLANFGGTPPADFGWEILAAQNVDLSIAKSASVATAFPGGNVVYTITASNAGPDTVFGARVVDTFPASLTCTWTCAGSAGNTCAASGTGGINDATVGLAAGGSVAYTATCAVSPAATGTLVNTATIFTPGTAVEANTADNSATNEITIAPIGPPTLAKVFGPLAILVNGTATLTFALTNPNPGIALSGVGFTDTLPAGLVVGTPNGLASTCGGTVTAVAGSASIGLVNGGLPAGGSCTITVSVAGTAPGLKSNTTSAVTSTEGGTGGTAAAFLVVVELPTPAPPTIAKAFGAATIGVNGTTTLTLTLANPNPVTGLTGVGFTDTLPAGLVVGTPNGLTNTCGGTVTAVAGTGSVALASGGLPANGSCTITVSVTGATAGVKTNTTSAVTSTEGGTGGTAAASLTVIAPPTIAKAFGKQSILANETTTLTFTLINPNAGTALSGLGFTDTLPAGLVVATPNGLASTCGGTVTAVAGSASIGLVNGGLAAGGSCTITVSVAGLLGGLKVNTTSAITSTEGGPGGTAAAFLVVVAPPAVAPPTIAKAFGTPIMLVNGTTALTFTLSNPNPGIALSGVGFTDTLPAGLVVATPNGLASLCGGTVTAVAGSGSIGLVNGGLPAGGSCTITVNVTGLTSGLKGNTTSAITSTEGGPGGTASASLVVVPPPVVVPPTIAKAFAVPSIFVDGTTTLSFTLTNPNPVSALSGVGFADTLPAGLVVGDPNGLASTCGGTVTAVAGTGSVDLINGGLPGGGSCTITLNVTGTTGGVKNNTTSAVTSTEGGTGGIASASLTVIEPPTIDKAFGTPVMLVNGTTALTLTLSNPNAGIALSGVGFTDTLPAGVVVGTPNGLASTCGGTVTAVAGSGSVALANGGLPAGGSCTITVSVTGATAGIKNNTTSAVTSVEAGTGGTAVAFLLVVEAPAVVPPAIAKAFAAPGIVVNGTTTLTFTLTNPNLVTALSGVGFTDTLPAGLVVGTPNGLANTCGGTVTAVAGAGSVTLANGGLLAGGSCTIALNVTGTTGGVKANTTSAVTSTEGGPGGIASASLAVIAPPTIAKAFGGSSIGVNETTKLTFTVANPAGNGAALTGVGFTDALPAGLVVATPNGLTGSCGGGTITATAGSKSISLAGATLAAGASCLFSINVQAVGAGTQVNTTSAATSANGGAGNAATASITVLAPPPSVSVPTLSPLALAALAILVLLIGLRRIAAK